MGNGGAARGCGGSRDAGGVYMEVGGLEGSRAMYEIIKDPVVPFDPASIDLSPIGVKIVEVDGVYHVFDWVGATHYPNASDFLEEAIRLGLSRRISKKEDFSKLTAASKLILVHPKAIINAPASYLSHRPVPCPTGKHPDPSNRCDCAGRLWLIGDPGSTDLEQDEAYEAPSGAFPDWAPFPVAPFALCGRRIMPSFTYTLAERPHDVEVKLSPGIIAIAPIERLAVVRHPGDPDAEADALSKARRSSLPVSLEDL